MAAMFNLFGRGKSEEKAVLTALSRLDKRKMPIRMEIETTGIRFTTMIAVKSNVVVVAKPPALTDKLRTGNMVRFKVPDEESLEIRMEISTPHFNLTSGSPVFLCNPPRGFAKSSNRAADRFSTRRYNNLRLHIAGIPEQFRILDMSTSGCRILTSFPNPEKKLRVGKNIGEAWIQLGNKAKVDLSQIVPRSVQGLTVGLEFKVSPNGNNKKLLHHMINSLDKQQKDTLRAESI